MANPVCTFCAGVHNDTRITATGKGTPVETEDGSSVIVDYSLQFTPESFRFERINVTTIPGIKSEPVQACQTCEKILYLVVKELKK